MTLFHFTCAAKLIAQASLGFSLYVLEITYDMTSNEAIEVHAPVDKGFIIYC